MLLYAMRLHNYYIAYRLDKFLGKICHFKAEMMKYNSKYSEFRRKINNYVYKIPASFTLYDSEKSG